MHAITKYWWLTLLRGIILVVLAIFVFRHPVNALVALGTYISLSLLLTGILQTTFALFTKNILPNWGWTLAGGLLDILFAIILFSNPAITASTIPFVVGFWIIFYGISLFANALQERKDGAANWWVGLLGAILVVFAGYNIMHDLMTGTLVITIWMGLGFLLAGILTILGALALKALKS